MDPTIKIRKKWIEVGGQVGLSPNVQGTTGLMFRAPVIKKSVEDYIKLISDAPYFRVMFDSHVDISKVKWADVASLLTDVWVDGAGKARLNYVVFPNTPLYDRLSAMGELGFSFAALSTRGFGRHVKSRPSTITTSYTRPSKDDPTSTARAKMLHDNPHTYFRMVGEQKHKRGGVWLEDFVLLGWDNVVAPSQNEAAVQFSGNFKTAMTVSEGGIIRKAFGDMDIVRESIITDLQACTGSRCYKPVAEAAGSFSMEFSSYVPPLRAFLTTKEEDLKEWGARLGSVSDLINRWI